MILTVLALVLLAVDFKKSGVGVFIKDPTGVVLGVMSDNIVSNVVLFQKLDSFSTEAISHARDELARRSKVGNSITGLLVGALTKVGLFPSIIAVLVTVSKIGENADGVYIYEILSFMLIGFYFICFRLGEVVFEFERYSDMLKSYLIQRASQAE